MSSTAVRTALQARLTEYVDAGFSGIYITTQEPDEAIREILAASSENKWLLHSFDMDKGNCRVGSDNGDGMPDPGAAIRTHMGRTPHNHEDSCLTLLPNFHRLFVDPSVVQTVQHAITRGKAERQFLVILAPVLQLPPELEKQFVVIDHELPDRNVLLEIMHNICGDDVPDDDDELAKLLDAAAGLTRYEAEGAFALSLARHNRLDVSVLWELKQGMLKKTGTLELYRGKERFDDLGGLDGLKAFCKQVLTSSNPKARPRGVMLLGVPGAGKSAFAKALGAEVGRPTVTLDFGALMGGLVGQTEENTRKALAAVDAMAPCILFVDEIEKGLSGATGGNGDSGVSSRMLGTLLTWLNDHTTDVFFVGTSNDMDKLSQVSAGAFTRAERFDGIFFIDLPSSEQRDMIWDMYLKQFELLDDVTLDQVDDTNWTGAEIKSCCRMAALRGITLKVASKSVIPVSKMSGDKIAALRNWANDRALDAGKADAVYSSTGGTASSNARRQVRRNGSAH